VGTARAMAHAYSAFATGELGLQKETLDLLAAPAIPPARGFYDECARSFGSPGTGGALGFADPDAGIGYGYVMCAGFSAPRNAVNSFFRRDSVRCHGRRRCRRGAPRRQ